MDINLDGLTLEDEGMTLNLETFIQTLIILDHCLIVRVLSDKEVQLAYLKERLGTSWKPAKAWRCNWLISKNGRFVLVVESGFRFCSNMKGLELFVMCVEFLAILTVPVKSCLIRRMMLDKEDEALV